jgi:hypothetical protein
LLLYFLKYNIILRRKNQMKNFKKKIALLSALALAGTMLAGCGQAKEGDTTEATTTAAEGDATEASETTTVAATEAAATKNDGTTLTVMTWNTEFTGFVRDYYLKDHPLPDGVTYNPVEFGVGGGDASQYFDQYMDSGKDLDLFCLEADWALTYLNSDKTTSLEAIGIKESELDGQYSYTKDLGRDSSGVLKAATFQACPGGYAYRSDLAEKYLNVKTPDEMQAKVKDWDTFLASAKTVKEASGGKTKMTASLGGVWQVFASSRNTPWVVDNKLVITEEVTDFLNLAKTMVDEGYVDPNIVQWTDSWLPLGTSDATMGYFVSTWGIGDVIIGPAAGGKGGATWGKWAVTEGPQAFYWGGTWIAPSSTCDNADLVADIIRYFCVNEDSMKAFAIGSNSFVNNKSVMQAIIDEGSGKVENLGGQDPNPIWLKNADKIDLSFMSEYDGEIKKALNTAYTSYVNGETDYDGTIELFKDQVAQNITTLDWDE